jgi:hypothetical protein
MIVNKMFTGWHISHVTGVNYSVETGSFESSLLVTLPVPAFTSCLS